MLTFAGSYTQSQWILLFFFYCLVGWVWETLYVSIRRRQWVDRGFLRGPVIPIYGSGALVILFLTLPVQENLVLVFLFGLVGASLLELVTGAVMERIFHTKYWDYSQCFLNYKGYICFKATACWGFFSVLLVRFVHPPVDGLVQMVPTLAGETLSRILLIVFTVDITYSVRTALDLKELMKSLSSTNRLLQEAEERLLELSKHIEQDSDELQRNLEQLRQSARERYLAHKEAVELAGKHRREYAAARLEEMREQRLARIAAIEQEMKTLREALDSLEEPVSDSREYLTEVRKSVQRVRGQMAARKNRDFARVASMLHRNPTAVSRHHREAFAHLRRLTRHGDEQSKNE